MIKPRLIASGQEETFDQMWERITPLIDLGGDLVLGLVRCRAVLRVSSGSRRGDEEDERRPTAAEGDSDEEEEEMEISVTVDLTRWNWRNEGELRNEDELTVMAVNIDNCWEIQSVLQVVRELDHFGHARLPEELQDGFKRKVAQLAFGLRALQGADIKQQLREVGLAVLEVAKPIQADVRTRRNNTCCKRIGCCAAVDPAWLQDAWQNTDVWRSTKRRSRWRDDETPAHEAVAVDHQRVFLISAPEHVLRHRAEAQEYAAKVMADASGRYVGGFGARQFARKGPTETLWLETKQCKYSYEPYFRPHRPEIDPAVLLTPAERRYVVQYLITDGKVLSQDDVSHSRNGGADLDWQVLENKNVIEKCVPISDHLTEKWLMREWVCPWKVKGWCRFLFTKLFNYCPERVVASFGPQVASFFSFLEMYHCFLVLPATFGVFAWAVGKPSESTTWRRGMQPLMGILVPLWSAVFLFCWRRRLVDLAYWWNNGWVELGAELQTHGNVLDAGRVREEFGIYFRSTLETASKRRKDQLLSNIRSALRVPPTEKADDEKQPFCDANLREDINHSDVACYTSRAQDQFRASVALLVNIALVALSCAGTAISFFLSDSSKDWGFNQQGANAVAGVVSAVAVLIVGLVQRQVTIQLTNWQCFRDDQSHEGALFNRLFMFVFFNTYNSLIYVAFWRQDMEQLRVQVLFLVVSSSAKGGLQEILLTGLGKCMGALQQVADGEGVLRRDGLKLRVSRHDTTGGLVARALEQVSDQLARGDFSLHDDEIKVALLYGMVLFFSLPCPLVPLIVFAGAVQEARVGAYKLTRLLRPPEVKMVVGVSRTYQVLVCLTGLSLLFNGALMYLAKYGNGKTGMQNVLPDKSVSDQLLCLFGVEHLLLIVFVVLPQVSPLSSSVRSEQFRQQYWEMRKDREDAEVEALESRANLRKRGGGHDGKGGSGGGGASKK